MKIYIMDFDPKKCAAKHYRRQLSNAILESTQILSNVHHINKSDNYEFIKNKILTKTLAHEPFTSWCSKSIDNYLYVSQLSLHLINEFSQRNNQCHKFEPIVTLLNSYIPKFESREFTAPPIAVPHEYIITEKSDKSKINLIETYNNYYSNKFKSLIEINHFKTLAV